MKQHEMNRFAHAQQFLCMQQKAEEKNQLKSINQSHSVSVSAVTMRNGDTVCVVYVQKLNIIKKYNEILLKSKQNGKKRGKIKI